MASSSGRTARLHVLITDNNKFKLAQERGNLSEAAFVNQILTEWFEINRRAKRGTRPMPLDREHE